MTGYLIDVNLGSKEKIREISKFMQYTKNNSDKFILYYGGKTYQKELEKVTSLLRHIQELKYNNMATQLPQKVVDDLEEKLKSECSKVHNDPHIYAISIISKLDIIVSQDNGISSFFRAKHSELKCNQPEYYYKKDSSHYSSFIRRYK